MHRPSMCSVLLISHKIPVWTYPPHMPHVPPLSSSQITYADNTWLKITEVLILKLSSVSCYFLPLTPKYLQEHPILETPLLLM